MIENHFPTDLINLWCDPLPKESMSENLPFSQLRQKIKLLCCHADRPILMMIDEVDNASNNEVFLHFLGLLRENYLGRQKRKESSFQSVILAGITDIRNLKMEIDPTQNLRLNSPWNIAADFDIDLSSQLKKSLVCYCNMRMIIGLEWMSVL